MQFSRFINRAIFCGTAFGMLTGCVTNLNYEKAVELVDVTHNEVIVDNLINRLKILARDSEFILADYAHHQLILTLSNNSIDDIALSESASFSKIHQMSPLLGQVNVLRIKLACKDLTSTQCIETLNDGNLQLDKEDIDLKIYFRGLSKVKAGLLSDGYDEFANLYYNYPLSEFADKSKERLSELRAKNLNKGDNNDLVKLELGRIKKLLSAYQFEQAIMESRILVRSKLSKPNKDLAQYIYAKSLQASKKRKQARGEYLKFLKQNEDSSMRDSALLNLAIIDWNLNNYSGARYFLKELLDNDATDKELKYRAYIILGRMSESENHNEDSTRMYQEAVKLSNNHKDNRYLRWRIGRLAYKREDYQAALNQFLNFQTEDDQTKYSDRFLYWGYKSALHSGLDAKAQSIKNRLIKEYPYNYYGTIVQGDKFNLQNSAQIQSARYKDRVNLDRVAKKSKLTDEESYHYRRLKLLKSLNMIDEALLEADRLSSLLDLKVEAEALFLSVIYNELGAYLQSFKSQHKISKSQLARHSADSLLWQLNYPLPYLELISKKAEEYNVNPFLILAIIKQESGFNSLAKSRSSALGLMQIMPETGKKLHKQVNMEEPKFSLYNSDLLYHPAVNITFGIALISQLLKKYDNNIVYALAAYNAGEPALQKWLKYNKHLPDDQFVEEISYNETKKYIKRVIENMAIYHLIYKRDFGKE